MCCPWEERCVCQHSCFLFHSRLRPATRGSHLRKQYQLVWLPLRSVYWLVLLPMSNACLNNTPLTPSRDSPFFPHTETSIFTAPAFSDHTPCLPDGDKRIKERLLSAFVYVWVKLLQSFLFSPLILCLPHYLPALTFQLVLSPPLFLPSCLPWKLSEGNQVSLCSCRYTAWKVWLCICGSACIRSTDL